MVEADPIGRGEQERARSWSMSPCPPRRLRAASIKTCVDAQARAQQQQVRAPSCVPSVTTAHD